MSTDNTNTHTVTHTNNAAHSALPSNQQGVKHRNSDKVSRIPIKIIPVQEVIKKPSWIRVRLPTSDKFKQVKQVLREHKLHTVCEEASCPNIGECFSKGTATFMIMGDICTRRCPFCDVGHGRPNPLDANEPQELANSVALMGLSYVVITSVDRDDLRDGGAGHFVACIDAIRANTKETKIEILVPDFRGRLEKAITILSMSPPDVLNHNLETVPRLYKQMRPGADYLHSLRLLKDFKALCPQVPTKSGLMVGLGEDIEEIKAVMLDMRAHNIEMLTIGQYLQPSKDHAPVVRYVHPDEFNALADFGYSIGFLHIASGPLVRSSYHADKQAGAILNENQM